MSDSLKTIACIYGRNEGPNLYQVLASVLDQSRPFDVIIYVDDCSTDGSHEILEQYMEIVKVYLDRYHEPFYDARLSMIANKSIDEVNRIKPDMFMILGADTVLSYFYAERCINELMSDSKLVMVSGRFEGELFKGDFPRGSGRFHKFWFWDQFIGHYPFTYSWESYPIYCALSQGLKVKQIPDLTMKGLRGTQLYKPFYGYSMRELGYFFPYALTRCLLAFRFEPLNALKMFKNYLISKRAYRREITDYIKTRQKQVLLQRARIRIFNLRYQVK